MNRKKKIIESYCLLFSDLLCIVIAYAAAILLRYGKFARVQEPEVHALVCVFFLLFCTIYSFLLDWNRSFLERGVLVEFVAVLKKYRKQGIAATMLRESMLLTNYRDFVLDVTDVNESAIKCYTNVGFEEFKRVPEKHGKQKGFNERIFMRYCRK